MTPASQFPAPPPPRLDRVFAPLCEVLPFKDIPALKTAVAAPVDEARAALKQNEFLDIAQTERIAAILAKLLDGYSGCAESARPQIVGAARYFVHTEDAESDTASLLGFDDDMEVLNYVLLSIGQAELCQELL